MSSRPESERSDWTDLDLLTRTEAADRLRAEITETETRLAAPDITDASERELLGARLRALRETLGDL
ncbi:hypothetical protein [Nocardia alni]|uniref:hypothetical protein n=1 Tax=Nocardia alni TaxID=2815723 RepID=UPI001C21BA64|nr:hypothetical protein [Nocardia alni]